MPLQGAFRLFRVAGIDVLLHWSWFVVAIIEIQGRRRSYSSPLWNVLEYLALFLIVLTHEFGHALACRQVGGKADRILLWPFGGVAYVNPPQRPGATLWSIAAGPLVNVVLLPVLFAAFSFVRSNGWAYLHPDEYYFIRAAPALPAQAAAWRRLSVPTGVAPSATSPSTPSPRSPSAPTARRAIPPPPASTAANPGPMTSGLSIALPPPAPCSAA